MKLSVVVCTRNRSQAIIACLDSIKLSLEKAVPLSAEIVVVDNASTDDTAAVVKAWANTSPFPVHTMYEPRKGVSRARNCGIRAAQGAFLVFTDDDCRMEPEYITRALAYDQQDAGPVLRGGCVVLGNPADLPLTILPVPVARRWSKSQNSARHENLGDCLLGCNMTMRKETALLIGPFDEMLGSGCPVPAGEDTDYIFRAYLAGVQIELVPDLVVFHHHGRRQLTEAAKLFKNYMLGSGALYGKFLLKDINLCRQFYWDVKNAICEIVQGKNNFRPDLKFSTTDKVVYSVKGAVRYWFLCSLNFLGLVND